ncbi:DUF1801 domain-containing protein [Chachezhania sediminis]|uniref:DUF1801 domain-containing protein n=1 Tax=Chachezhania sediminis TaxID=2599291 RepID=UPI00131CE962|nr:DUF1801 domain-containing protein [Chachezhania sediminis]
MTFPETPTAIAAVFAAMPLATQARARELRALVHEVAKAEGVTKLEEGLRWREPAFLPGRAGTAVRIAPDGARDGLKMLVHCQTSLIEDWRARFDGRLDFEGNRAVLIPTDAPLDRDALAACIADALTYRRKRDPKNG